MLLIFLLLPGMPLLASAAGVIHVRSASRKGYWDFGVNRRRVEAIREAFGNIMEAQKGGGPGNR
jgi:hypothetical protein